MYIKHGNKFPFIIKKKNIKFSYLNSQLKGDNLSLYVCMHISRRANKTTNSKMLKINSITDLNINFDIV